MMKKSIVLLLLVMSMLPLNAQIRGSEITVMVTPDHQDWTYRVGETCRFTVSVLRSGTLIDNALVDYEAGPEMYPEVKKTGVVLKDGTMKHQGTMKVPGFYRLSVTAHVNGKDYKGACGAAFSPEQLQPSTVMPSDFQLFWQGAIDEARKTDLNPTKRLLPERCTKDVNVYEVSFNNILPNYRTYGILCVPVDKEKDPAKAGRYPALLRVPGAGVRPYGGDVYTASQGAITLEIGIHGIPVTMDQKVYDDIYNGALTGYWEFNMDNRDKHYYKRVIVGCIRALDYIEQFTPWNGKEMGVTGSSQGGFLSLATAGLDKRITFYAPVHAALCDHTNSLKGVACGWPHYFYGSKKQEARGKKSTQTLPKEGSEEKRIEVSRYYDGINFARLITEQQQGWFSFGYNDDVVPPTTAWATYNTVKGPKTISPYQATWHFWFQEQWDEWEQWLLNQLRIEN
jgi:cephalosporin-C deacetylase-like acetyl esterase